MHHLTKVFIISRYMDQKGWDKRLVGRKIRQFYKKHQYLKTWDIEKNHGDAQRDGAK
jgi:hypothetical protein